MGETENKGQLSTTDTVTKLQNNKSNTLNWDVAVNYGLPEINRFLSDAHKEEEEEQKNDEKDKTKKEKYEKSILKVKCQITDTNDEGDDYTIDYDLHLDRPEIQFISSIEEPYCSLTIPIKSGTASTKKATQNIGANIYKLVVRNLKTGTASVEDTSSDTYKKADQTFQFADGKTEKAAVVIELSSAKKKDPKRQAQEMDILAVDVGILDEAASKKIGFVHRHIAAIEKELKEEIVKHKVRYELAHINSKPPPSDTVQLVPKSFRFVTYVKDKTDKDTKDETPPALSLLIQTSDKDNGEKAGVQRKWGTLWNDTNKCSPIPKGHTASIIFKKLMIYGKMIAPALKSQSYDSELVSSQGDLQVLVKTGIKKHRERECTVNPIAGGLGTETRTVSEINVTLDPLRLILNQSSSNKAQCSGKWQFSYTFDWSYCLATSSSQNIEAGTITANNKLDKQLSMVTYLDDQSLKASCTIAPGDWKVELTGAEKDWWSRMCGGTSSIPGWIHGLLPELPAFDLKLGSLNFFLTTNLLTPSKTVIKVDTDTGLMIPGDFYVVGKVNNKTTSS